MRFTLGQIKNQAQKRPQGYLEEILSLSKEIESGIYELQEKDYEQLVQKYRLPSMLKMASGLLQAAVNHIQDPTKRSKEEIEQIIEICAVCPFLIVDEFRCSRCGCYLERKVSLDRNTSCPEGKW